MPSVTITVNGKPETREVENRTLLVQFLREHLGLTGTHVGCDTSQCGACVVLYRRLFGQELHHAGDAGERLQRHATIEGLANGDQLHPMQEAFRENHGLQCGFCTPGMVMSAVDLLRGQSEAERARDPRVARRQYLPLHRLPQHRQGNRRLRRETGEGLRGSGHV